MRTHVIVIVAPGFDNRARLVQVDEHVFVQAFIAQPAVKGFDESILDWLSGLDIDDYRRGDGVRYKTFVNLH